MTGSPSPANGPERQTFNLSDWALRHRSLIWYFMLIFAVAGVLSYINLGREEDPSFTIKTMVIQANWPGATLEETVNQVTDRIEKKLQELDTLDYTKSMTVPGQTTINVNLLPTTRAGAVTASWQRVRNMINDIQAQFPSGVQGPFFNDQFGDVYGNIYAFTADGLSQRQLRDDVEKIRSEVLTVPDAGRVDLIGAQDEVIYMEFNPQQIASLGLDEAAIIQALRDQNAIAPSGVIETGPERISIRVSGQFVSEKSLKDINLRVNDRFFHLSDVVTIQRGYKDPPSSLFRYDGKPAIGLAIGMRKGANLLDFGKALRAKMQKVEADLPIGVSIHQVSNQPQIVKDAIGQFTRALFEAVVIVLVVSFISLGMRAGLVVALAIPLVLAMTFVGMEYLGITLQRISLGALIIALGLLVDDAMIAVEMMVARLEEGDSLEKAATHVYTSTAFPMLTGTAVTVAGFIPIGLNSSAAGEFTFTLFVVIALSLALSWIVAVLFTPLIGVTILPRKLAHHAAGPGRFLSAFKRLLLAAMHYRWVTIGVTVLVFGLSVFGMKFVQQQFFPSSDRDELLVIWNLPQNASILETKAQMDRFEKSLAGDADIDHWSSYVGRSAVRFVLSYDEQPSADNYGEIVIVAKDLEARNRLRQRVDARLKKNFVGIDVYTTLLALGPPSGRPIQYRVSGPDIQKVRTYAAEMAGILGSDHRLTPPTYDWNEPARVVKVDVLQDKARELGVSSSDIASALNGTVEGINITQIRDSIYLINVVARGVEGARDSIETLRNLQMPNRTGNAIPLGAIARFHYAMEQPRIWRRNRLPTITVSAGIIDSTQPDTIVSALSTKVKAFAASLPPDYGVAVGGPVEDSAQSQAPIIAVLPLMLLIMTTILMVQLQSFQRLFLVFSVAPLALIGVVAALLPSGAPMGFVAILGILALIGILIRNSVILIVQIETLIRDEGKTPWDAVVEATLHRFRPIMLTAAAASLGLIPIAREVFWGPMAYAMMGGIIVGTVMTLIFLPALYVAWFRIHPDDKSDRERPAA
ncbi:efflux RND transporter permease subunit [Allorhizobium sp. BGMRC 0089]|uniref:efflux RND transporter permease subunit n=1 Tax=Allorhizobium sonneratiae TaxID=2934936 RepID=UPI00203365CB|nr:efflux RND transporter permease subunit [Allorhizobium sonneratiae]MCM2292462.1 efflux RND transporter permease subunit [Allorhizobium sonneratiae]